MKKNQSDIKIFKNTIQLSKEGGQRDLVKNAEKVVLLEGCFVQCASRMMAGILEHNDTKIILTDKYAVFDENIFGMNELTSDEIDEISITAVKEIIQLI